MRILTLVVAGLAFAATAAIAAERPTTGPNGIDVKGPTWYVLDASTGRVIHIRDLRDTRLLKEGQGRTFWKLQEMPGGPSGDSASSSSGNK